MDKYYAFRLVRGRLQRTSAKISDFQTNPLSLSGCVRISKTTPPPLLPGRYTFLFLLIKTKFIAQFLFL